MDEGVDFYQVSGEPNAAYLHQAGKAVILFQGALLDRLDEDELTAVIGHELAHRLLWQAEDGGYLAVDRLLDAAAGDARTPSQYLETHRRWSLATELFADRGAVTACGDLSTAIRALLKLETGLSTADPAAYLRQAESLDLRSGSRGTSHPEAVGRAWALKNWLDGEDVEVLVTGPLDVDAPDLLDAVLLRELSRDFAAAIAHTDGLRTDAIATAASRLRGSAWTSRRSWRSGALRRAVGGASGGWGATAATAPVDRRHEALPVLLAARSRHS